MTTVTRNPVKNQLDSMGMKKADKAVDEEYGLGIGGVVIAKYGGRKGGKLAVR